MDYSINVTIRKQKLSFDYGNILNIYEIEDYQKMNFYISPNFSEEWQILYKYICFSTNEKDYEYYKVEDTDLFEIPKNLLTKPKIAFYFYVKDKEDENCNFRISTNFLIINMLGDD